MRRRRELSPEERRLWAEVARTIVPLPGKVLPETEPPPPPVAQPRPPIEPRGATAAAVPSAVVRPAPLAPIERRLRQRVARGQRPVDGVLDLHGHRQAEAHASLLRFLHRRHAEGATLVLVITGKGEARRGPEGDGQAGVLRRLVPHWLAEPALRPVVMGFEPAARGHGGEGALYVRLRRRRSVDG